MPKVQPSLRDLGANDHELVEAYIGLYIVRQNTSLDVGFLHQSCEKTMTFLLHEMSALGRMRLTQWQRRWEAVRAAVIYDVGWHRETIPVRRVAHVCKPGDSPLIVQPDDDGKYKCPRCHEVWQGRAAQAQGATDASL